jgi:hypothetical protein
MNEGYVIEGANEHYCSDECLHKNVTPDDFEKFYIGNVDEDDADIGDIQIYWTEWENETGDEGEQDNMTQAALNVIDAYLDADLCRGGNGEDENELREARRLAAAAPDLLAALIELQQMVEAGENNEGTHEIVRNAINKAKGN